MEIQQSARRKRNRIRARFFSLILIISIIAVIGYFFWQTTSEQMPNLHGWESAEVLNFARDNEIEVHFEFIYSTDMAPTLVMSQSIPPRTILTEDMSLSVEISKGVEVR